MTASTKPALACFLGLALLAPGCGGSADVNTDPGWQARDTTLLPPWEQGCDNDHVPVVMVHGFLASGDTYTNHVMRFTANGYCLDRLFVYDWNSIGGGNSPERLDTFVDEVLSVTGATQLDLMGHSAGGGVGYAYLGDATRAAKVRRYVHIASGDQEAPAGPTGNVPTLNLYSANDRVISTNDGIDGAQNRLAAAQDLKRRLELILEGEPPYDIFVRWKPLAEQPIGWNPDLNDGVRLNIRPFMTAEVLRHNKKPKLNITWDKDRGKDVESAPWFHKFKGDRINDHHLTVERKMAARSRE